MWLRTAFRVVRARASSRAGALAELFGSLSDFYEPAIPLVQKRNAERDAERCKCEQPTLVSRPASSSQGIAETAGLRHYGVCYRSVVVDLSLFEGTGVGWQTSSAAASSAAGMSSASAGAAYVKGIQGSMLEYRTTVFKILQESNQKLSNHGMDNWVEPAIESLHETLIKNTTSAGGAFFEVVLKTSRELPLDPVSYTPPEEAELRMRMVFRELMDKYPLLNLATLFKPIGHLCHKEFGEAFWSALGVGLTLSKVDPKVLWLTWFAQELYMVGKLNGEENSQLEEAHTRFMSTLAKLKSEHIISLLASLSIAATSVAAAEQGQSKGIITLRPFEEFAQGTTVTFHEEVRVDDFERFRDRALASMGNVEYELTTCNCEHYALWVLTGKADWDWSQGQTAAGIFGGLGVGGAGAATAGAVAAMELVTTTTIPATLWGSTGWAVALPELVSWFGTQATVVVSAAPAGAVVGAAAVAGVVLFAVGTVVCKKINENLSSSPSGAQGKFEDLLRKKPDDATKARLLLLFRR